MKEFELADVLSITTGVLMSRRHMDGVYDIVGYMTGDEDITTIGLLRGSSLCEEKLLRRFPQLSGLRPPSVELYGLGALERWLTMQERKFGKTLPVEPLPPGSWVRKNPVQEFVDIAQEFADVRHR